MDIDIVSILEIWCNIAAERKEKDASGNSNKRIYKYFSKR